MAPEIEREHIRLGIETIERVAGVRPVGWMTGRPSANTRRLHLELGGFLYDRDSLNDELPYWVTVGGMRHLVIPYSFETNDNRFDQNHGFSSAEDFARYMIACFDTLYAEGADKPKLMSLALHDRLIGRPGRIALTIVLTVRSRNPFTGAEPGGEEAHQHCRCGQCE